MHTYINDTHVFVVHKKIVKIIFHKDENGSTN